MNKKHFLPLSERQQTRIVTQAKSLAEGLRRVHRSFVLDGYISALPSGDNDPKAADTLAALRTASKDMDISKAIADVTYELRRVVTCVDEFSSLAFLRQSIGGAATGLDHLSEREALEGLSEGEICYELSRRLETLVSHVYSIRPVFKIVGGLLVTTEPALNL